MTHFAESIIEQAAIDWLQELGYSYAFGPEIAFDGASPERGSYDEPLLLARLRDAVTRINPGLPAQAQGEALRKITHLYKPSLLLNNHAFHHLLVNGIEVEYKATDGRMVKRPGVCGGFRKSRAQRLVGGEPVHGGSIAPEWKGQPADGCGGVRQRPAASIWRMVKNACFRLCANSHWPSP